MEDRKLAKLLNFLTSAVIGFGLAFAIMYWRGIFEHTELYNIFAAMSDGFFVTGVIYTGFGLMLLIVNEGVLDIIGFGFKSLVYLFTPRKLERSSTDYYEYRMKKKEERAAKPVNTNILWIGLGFILLSIISVILAYNI